jgi:acyl carrier protein
MEINHFIAKFAEQLENTPVETVVATAKFKDLDAWSSLTALSVIAMIDVEYEVTIKGKDIRAAETVEDLFNVVKSLK